MVAVFLISAIFQRNLQFTCYTITQRRHHTHLMPHTNPDEIRERQRLKQQLATSRLQEKFEHTNSQIERFKQVRLFPGINVTLSSSKNSYQSQTRRRSIIQSSITTLPPLKRPVRSSSPPRWHPVNTTQAKAAIASGSHNTPMAVQEKFRETWRDTLCLTHPGVSENMSSEDDIWHYNNPTEAKENLRRECYMYGGDEGARKEELKMTKRRNVLIRRAIATAPKRH